MLDIAVHADTLSVSPTGKVDMLVKMNLARIVIVDSEDEKMSMIVLRELEGERAPFRFSSASTRRTRLIDG